MSNSTTVGDLVNSVIIAASVYAVVKYVTPAFSSRARDLSDMEKAYYKSQNANQPTSIQLTGSKEKGRRLIINNDVYQHNPEVFDALGSNDVFVRDDDGMYVYRQASNPGHIVRGKTKPSTRKEIHPSWEVYSE